MGSTRVLPDDVAVGQGRAALGAHGWDLIGGFRTAMVDDDELLLLWAIPTWAEWAAGEAAPDDDHASHNALISMAKPSQA